MPVEAVARALRISVAGTRRPPAPLALIQRCVFSRRYERLERILQTRTGCKGC